MVTPASIFAEMAASEDLAEPEEMEDTRLGSIPTRQQETAAALESGESEHVGAVEDMGVEEGDTAESRLASLIGTGHFAQKISHIKRPTKAAQATTQVWLPLTFPTIPAKGDFDVRRLKGSKYFFS